MHMIPPHAPSIKTTSFSMFSYLWSLFFVKNQDEFNAKVEKTKNDLLSEVRELNQLDISITNGLEKNTEHIIEAKLFHHFREIDDELRANCGVYPISKNIANQRVILTFNNEQEIRVAANFLETHYPQFERKIEKKRENNQVSHTISLKSPDLFKKQTKDKVLLCNQGEIQLTSIKIEQLVESIKNQWNKLSYLYTSNSLEKFFNKFGSDIDDLKRFVNTKVHTLIHPDRHSQSPYLQTFNRLTAVFTEDPRRQNPLTSNEFKHAVVETLGMLSIRLSEFEHFLEKEKNSLTMISLHDKIKSNIKDTNNTLLTNSQLACAARIELNKGLAHLRTKK